MNPDAFAAMIAGLEANGIPRPEIVRRTGLSKNTVWRMANGTLREPKYETVEKVKALQARVERTAALAKQQQLTLRSFR
jgi:hypothetical protein